MHDCTSIISGKERIFGKEYFAFIFFFKNGHIEGVVSIASRYCPLYIFSLCVMYVYSNVSQDVRLSF